MDATEDFMNIWNRIVLKSRIDEFYRARLLSSPMDVLRAEGVELPEGRSVKVVLQAENESVLVLPAAGPSGEDGERIVPFRMF